MHTLTANVETKQCNLKTDSEDAMHASFYVYHISAVNDKKDDKYFLEAQPLENQGQRLFLI